MSAKHDLEKAKVTVHVAIQFYDQLAKALEQNDQRAVGANMYRLRRELDTLKELLWGREEGQN